MPKTNKQSKERTAGSLRPVVSRRLTSKQWDDVADLCNEAAVACETGYEEHDWQSRQKAAQWMMALAMKAQGKAANPSSATGGDKMSESWIKSAATVLNKLSEHTARRASGSLKRVVSCPSKTQRCFRDGKWQVDELANLSEKLEREISAIEDAVNASGTAIGDDHNRYTTAERIRDITAQRDYFMRECDKARAANA